MTYRMSGPWRWYERIVLTITLGGGGAMLLIAAVAQDVASIPLVTIGGVWFALGLAELWFRRTVVSEVLVEKESVTFTARRRKVTIPATEIVEVRRGARYDINNMRPLEVRTENHGAIRLDSHLRGLLDLLVELRLRNPELDTSKV